MFNLSVVTDYLAVKQQFKQAEKVLFEEYITSLASYNTVAKNLAVKFQSDILSAEKILKEVALPQTLDGFKGVEVEKQALVFEFEVSTNKYLPPEINRVLVPLNLLANDPVTHAVYIRKQIRQLQTKTLERKLEELEKQTSRVIYERDNVLAKENILRNQQIKYRKELVARIARERS